MSFVDVESHAHEMQVGSQTCKSDACALGAARLLLKLSVQFNSNLWTLPKTAAQVVDVRTRQSVPISAACDAAASSWSLSQTESIHHSGPRK